jgi:DNA repair exonuclease SbcCD ATPase subunit
MADELLDIADELYALALPDFTPARDARVKALKGTDLAAPVKALKKPSLAAWVVNLLVRREGEQVERILEIGASLREAQAAMSGDDLRALTRQRRQVTAAITQQARSLASEVGVKVTSAVGDQVEATLTAAMLDERCAEAVRSGLLVAALSSTGMGETDLSGAVALPEALGFTASQVEEAPPPGRPELHVVPDPEADAKAVAAAREALEAAEEELTEAQSAYDDAAGDVERLEARSMQVQAEIDELRRKLAELEETSEEVDEELEGAEETKSEAQDALDEAAKARDKAAKRLDKLQPD